MRPLAFDSLMKRRSLAVLLAENGINPSLASYEGRLSSCMQGGEVTFQVTSTGFRIIGTECKVTMVCSWFPGPCQKWLTKRFAVSSLGVGYSHITTTTLFVPRQLSFGPVRIFCSSSLQPGAHNSIWFLWHHLMMRQMTPIYAQEIGGSPQIFMFYHELQSTYELPGVLISRLLDFS